MNESKGNHASSMRRAERDLVALGIAAAAILLFVGTGGAVVPKILRSWLGTGDAPDSLLVNALLLNIALILFGWRRHRELMQEIQERRQAEERATALAEKDPLTGCLNRRSLLPAVERLMSRERTAAGDVAMLMIDIDNFKQINDLHGHSTGDQVLITTARRMAALMPPDGLIARIGGDEFACAIPYRKGESDGIDLLVARLIEKVAGSMTLADMPVEVTMSVGIATSGHEPCLDHQPTDSKTLMHRADIAMYHAKKEGKNRYFWFEPQMETELRVRNELERAIRRGLANGEFVPYYEQQIDLETGELVGFEMLARWNCLTYDAIGPTVFVPIAEEIGLIGELSEQLIGRALEDAKTWAPELTLSVNISPVQLRDQWFSQKLLKMLVAHNFPPHRLEIEITESCLHENLPIVRSMVASLRNQGVKVTLDDFGTGYSSLSQLKSLPFDRIKIDRSFVSELRGDGTADKIIDAIVKLGQGLQMPITAEGIEDDAILGTLKQFRDLKGQGYLYGQPENAAQVRSRLAEIGKLAVGSDAGDQPEPVVTPAQQVQQKAG